MKTLEVEVVRVKITLACTAVSYTHLYQRTGFTSYIYLNMINIAVAHIGDRKVNDAVTSKERKCCDRTVI